MKILIAEDEMIMLKTNEPGIRYYIFHFAGMRFFIWVPVFSFFNPDGSADLQSIQK